MLQWTNIKFKTKLCTLDIRRAIFITYIYGSLYCLSCVEKISQCIKNTYRFALLKFFGNLPHINTRNINNVTTHTSTLTVNAGILSLGELHRKLCLSLYNRMTQTENLIIKSFSDFAIYKQMRLLI